MAIPSGGRRFCDGMEAKEYGSSIKLEDRYRCMMRRASIDRVKGGVGRGRHVLSILTPAGLI